MDTKAAFEKWFESREIEMKKNGLGLISIARSKMRDWEAWQASRAAIEITPLEEYSDSPLDIIYEQPDNLSRDEVTQFGYMRGYNDCLNELSTSHGIRIKGKTE